MHRRKLFTILVVVLLLAIGVTAAQAQESNGAIRGTLFNDTNADGVCGVGDPTISGVPVSFTHSGGHTITLTSGNDGTYGLAGVSLGTWSVAAQPLSGWRTTSLSPIVVTLTTSNSAAAGVNFCLAQTTTTTTPATPTPVPPTTLPESGAGFPPAFLLVLVAGAVLLFGGLVLIARDRRATD